MISNNLVYFLFLDAIPVELDNGKFIPQCDSMGEGWNFNSNDFGNVVCSSGAWRITDANGDLLNGFADDYFFCANDGNTKPFLLSE